MLVLCLLVGLCCFPAAAEVTDSGACGDNASWTFDASTGTLTISGTGVAKGQAMDSSNEFAKYRAQILHLVIEEGITAIGSPGFPRLYNMQSVQIADSVKTIEKNAFFMCEALTELDLGTGVTTIEETAFNSCFSLKTVILPASLQTLGAESFSDTNLKSIAIPESLCLVDNGTFRAADLTKVYLPASITQINYAAFRGCEALTDVYYAGTQTQWEAINIDTNNDDPYRGNNEHLLSANIHFEHKHTWNGGAVTRQATCRQKGVKTYTCTVCGGAKQETFSGSHKWDNGTVTAATCIKDGAKVFTCSVCKETKEEKLAATGHSWDNGTKNADTTISYSCKNCSATRVEGTPAAPSETTAPTVAVDATVMPTMGDTIPPTTVADNPDNATSPTENTAADTQEIKPGNSFPLGVVIGAAVLILAGSGTGLWFWLKKRK